MGQLFVFKKGICTTQAQAAADEFASYIFLKNGRGVCLTIEFQKF